MSLTAIESFWAATNGSDKPTQLQRYIHKGSPECIKRFIAIGGGSKMGTTLEKFARFTFPKLQSRSNTGHDHIFAGIKPYKVEQKSSGHWGEEDYKWQHVEAKHDWDILLLCGIDYHCIKFWIMNRKIFQTMIDEGRITNQGNKNQESSQGVWFNYSDVKDVLVEVRTQEELQIAIEHQASELVPE